MSIPRFAKISNVEMLVEFGFKNEAFLLDSTFTRDWRVLQLWVTANGKPNINFLSQQYGNAEVPVFVGKNSCDYQLMKFGQFVEILKRGEIAYLKDWHFQSEFLESDFYVLPAFLKLDWINCEKWTNSHDNAVGGDYRFVYFGTAGSWTKFHSDVMESFSWSANVCGRKLWYLLTRGNEKHFRISENNFIEDIREMRHCWKEAGVVEFVQEPGEIVFIPSGWYHQVHNLEDSISINHNVINVCNVHYLYQFIAKRLLDVKKEIADVKNIFSVTEFKDHCQKLLLLDCRMNVPKLSKLLNAVCSSRQSFSLNDAAIFWHLDLNDNLLENLSKLKVLLNERCECQNNQKFCLNCSNFLAFFEWDRANFYNLLNVNLLNSE